MVVEARCKRLDHTEGRSRINVSLRANKRETIDWLKFTLEGVGEEPWLCLHNQRFCPMLDLVLFWPRRRLLALLLRRWLPQRN